MTLPVEPAMREPLHLWDIIGAMSNLFFEDRQNAGPEPDVRQGRNGPIPTAPPEERAVLVGVELSDGPWNVKDSLDELEQLAETASVRPVGRVVQKLSSPDPRTFIGKGKVQELREARAATDATVVLFDDELTPSQERNLAEALGCMVADRTALILYIVA